MLQVATGSVRVMQYTLLKNAQAAEKAKEGQNVRAISWAHHHIRRGLTCHVRRGLTCHVRRGLTCHVRLGLCGAIPAFPQRLQPVRSPPPCSSRDLLRSLVEAPTKVELTDEEAEAAAHVDIAHVDLYHSLLKNCMCALKTYLILVE